MNIHVTVSLDLAPGGALTQILDLLAAHSQAFTQLETVIMTQADRLNTALDAAAAAITSEMTDLAAAIAKQGVSDPAIDASIQRVNDLVAQLGTDDAPVTPPADPAV